MLNLPAELEFAWNKPQRAENPLDLATGPPLDIVGSYIRLIIPDSHGEHIDWGFANGMLLDIEKLAPDIKEVVWLGDHLDCGGTFNAHQRNYTNEMCESYLADVNAALRLIRMVTERTPFANHHYLEGNHEQHVERFLARNFQRYEDAEFILNKIGPRTVLKLDEYDIKYYRSSQMHCGLATPGTIKLGRCLFTHGMLHAKNAAAAHLARCAFNVVFGHVHRSMSVIERTVMSEGHGAWCPGTLAKLQPLYRHTNPTDWTGGYGLQFVESDGLFSHINVPLFGNNNSGLGPLLRRLY